jgi:leader peptidase (prepilin peptidase)/N-methyltransferase
MVFLFLLFVLGTIVGSFLNVCIWRLPRHESVSNPPSHCPKCNTRLKLIDLWPLLSQVLLRGKCRYCGSKFSWRYAGVEFLTGILFLLVGLQEGNLTRLDLSAGWSGDPVKLLADLLFMATLTVIFWVDYDTYMVQIESTFLLGLTGVALEAYRASQGQDVLTDGKWFAFMLPAKVPESILAAVVVAFFLFLLRGFFSWLFKKEAMGFGDVLIVAAIATHLGWNATLFTFLFFASTVGSVVGLGLRLPSAVKSYHRAKQRIAKYGADKFPADLPRALAGRRFRQHIAFGPMLAIGAIIALLYGERINTAYMDYIEQGSSLPPLAMIQKDAKQ